MKDKRGKEHKLGVSICYEAIIPRFVNGLDSENPAVFINITNDSWYGNTRESFFHFHLQDMHAVEYRIFDHRFSLRRDLSKNAIKQQRNAHC